MTAQSWVLPEELRQLAENGDTSLVDEVLDVFVSDTAERLAAVQAACRAVDRAELRKQAHALKGSSGQVGALALASLCRTLESAAPGAAAPELADIVARMTREFEAVRRQIDAAKR